MKPGCCESLGGNNGETVPAHSILQVINNSIFNMLVVGRLSLSSIVFVCVGEHGFKGIEMHYYPI